MSEAIPCRTSEVAAVRCDSYDQSSVHDAVARGLELLGGVESLFQPGESVLLKPNLLQAKPPEGAVCVHPEVFRAVANALSAKNLHLTYGDSPAIASAGQAASASGIAAVAAELSIPMADFKNCVVVAGGEGCLVRKLEIATGINEADAVVSISKLKTHTFTGMTGAVKNTFGCIPGIRKAEFHARFPEPDAFSRMLVEVALAVSPRLHVMDAVIAMEGKGPSAGRPRAVNLMLFSRDPIAIDAVAARIIGMPRELLYVLDHGSALGLGNPDPKVLGDDPEQFMISDFDLPQISHFRPDSLAVRLFRNWILSRPVIDANLCSRCGQCVSICPVKPKALTIRSADAPPTFSGKRCIRCFCCQEVCPEHAIDTRTPLPGKLLHKLSRN